MRHQLICGDAAAKSDVIRAEKQRLSSSKRAGGLAGEIRIERTSAYLRERLIGQNSVAVRTWVTLKQCRRPFPHVSDQLVDAVGRATALEGADRSDIV